MERIANLEMKPVDIPLLALFLLCVIVVLVLDVGSFLYFFVILFSSLFDGVTNLWKLIPCVMVFCISMAVSYYIFANED